MTTYPPDGYTFDGGVWGTDADRSTTSRSGGYSIEFKNTTPAGDLRVYSGRIPCGEGDVLRAEWWVRASSIASGNWVKCDLYWYNSSDSYQSTTTLFEDELSAANTWLPITGSATVPASISYVRIAFTKQNIAFTAYLDFMALKKVNHSFLGYLATDTATATLATLPLDSEAYDYGSWYVHTTSIATIPQDGIYTFNAGYSTDAEIDDGKSIAVFLCVDDGGGYDIWCTGTSSMSSADNSALSTVLSFTGYFTKGHLVKPIIGHSQGGNISVQGSASLYPYTTFFSGSRVA